MRSLSVRQLSVPLKAPPSFYWQRSCRETQGVGIVADTPVEKELSSPLESTEVTT